MGATIPMGRAGLPSDIAKAALFFASDDSEFVTAQNVIVDGGESTGTVFSQQGLN